MRFAWLCAGAVVATVLVGGGCSASRSTESSESSRTSSTQQPIQDGENDTTHRFAVGVCNGSPGNCFGICSGALILPNVVATARHCVDASPKAINCQENPSFGARKGGAYNVTTNASMKQGGSAGWYSVKSIAVPDDTHICGNDIALLVLTAPVPATDTKPITPGVQYQMWDPDHYHPVFTAIGYGITGPNNNDSQTRRIRNFISVQCVPGSDNMPCPPAVMKYFSPAEFWGGDGTCSGDSGSSAFESNALDNGAPVSFGVLSRGSEVTPDGGTPECSQSFYTRFDAHRDFVLQVAKQASANWSLYPEPSWTAYAPPPASKKDAGADGSVSTKPSAGGLGDVCTTESECASKVCADAGDGSKICSKACDEADPTSCDDGYTCRESLCLPAVATTAAPAATTTKTTGCSFATPASPTAWGWGVVGAAVALTAARRRKR